MSKLVAKWIFGFMFSQVLADALQSNYKINDFIYDESHPIEYYFSNSNRNNVIAKHMNGTDFEAIIIERQVQPEDEMDIRLGERSIRKLGLNLGKNTNGFPEYLMIDMDQNYRKYYVRTCMGTNYQYLFERFSLKDIFKFMCDIISALPALHSNNLVLPRVRPNIFTRYKINNVSKTYISYLFGVLEKDSKEWKMAKGDEYTIFASSAFWTKEKIYPIHNYEALGWVALAMAANTTAIFSECYSNGLHYMMTFGQIGKIKMNGKNMNVEAALRCVPDSNEKNILITAFKKYFRVVFEAKPKRRLRLFGGNLLSNQWVWPKTTDLLACFSDDIFENSHETISTSL